MAGLARNGVIGWWAAPVALLPMIAGPMAGGVAGAMVGSLVGAACCAPLVLIAVRLLRRTSPGVTAFETASRPRRSRETPLPARSGIRLDAGPHHFRLLVR